MFADPIVTTLDMNLLAALRHEMRVMKESRDKETADRCAENIRVIAERRKDLQEANR